MGKTIKQHERERNLMLRDRKLAGSDKSYTDDEFNDLIVEQSFVGVDFAQRTAFLRANGYEVNDANMINSDLSVKEN